MTSVVDASELTEVVPVEARWRRILPVVAGPALIVVGALVGTRGFAFQNLLTTQHPDILAFWLPRFCFLGDSLGAGHVPLWNPHQFAGVPFESDPQSGWLYAPAMGLFSTLSCGGAMRALIVLNPILAGLGLYWFLRTEGLHRVASTAGGLSLAMLIAASNIAVSLPFVAMLAWTPYVLVGAARFLRAPTLPRRLGWLALAAVAWGQVGAAHLSHGLAMASLVTLVYLVVRVVWQVREGDLSPGVAVSLVIGFAAFLVASNLALFIPRIALLDRTSLREGYAAIGGAAAASAGLQQRPLAPTGFWSGWPLSLASSPGAYAGAVILFAVPAAIRAARRHLALAFAITGAAAYVLTFNFLIDARWFRTFVLNLPFGDVYLHNPGRLRYLMLLVVPVLGALGIQGFLERPLPMRAAAKWIGAGVALWLVVPLVLGAHPIRMLLLVIAVAGAVPALFALSRGKPWGRPLVVGVLAAELLGSALYSQAYEGGTIFLGLEQDTSGKALMPQPLRWPDVPLAEYLDPGPIVDRMRGEPGRYITWDPPDVFIDKGYLFEQGPETWPGLENARGMLFGLDDAMGYSPVQLTRYWSWVRAVNATPVFYNAAVLHHPTLQDLRALAVRWLIVPTGVAPPVSGRRILDDHGFTLHEVPGNDRVSLVFRWQLVSTGGEALRVATDDGFDPQRQAVLQQDPGVDEPTAGSGSVSYTEPSPEHLVIHVRASVPAIVVIHDGFDSRWTASVDGGPARHILSADYFLQAVPVTAGEHTIDLRYSDPEIGRGLAASAIAWGAFALTLGGAILLARRRRYPSLEESPSDGAAAGTGSTGA